MKVLFLSAANSIHTVKWVNALVERNHEIHLVYNCGHEPSVDKIDERVVLYKLKYSGTKGYYLNAYELNKICEKIEPDVINVHYASGYGTLARVARLESVILSIWGSDVYEFPYQSRLKRLILKKNVNYASALASTSHCMAMQLRMLMRDLKKEITITPFGIDLEIFSKDEFQEYSDKIVIGNIKTLKPLYGISDLIKAAHLMLIQLPEEISKKVIVEIYGDGEQKEELEREIYELNEQDRIFLKGKIPNLEVPAVLNRFAIFCATSHHESFGVSVIEAMAMKIPVVVTNVDGFKEVIEDGVTGIEVNVGNSTQIANALCELVLNKEKRKIMGENGRKRVEKLYNWYDNVTVMENLYEKMARMHRK